MGSDGGNARKAAPTGERPFHIGLTMAGAVSAGAYAAGVMDFLLEALSEWEKAKASDDPAVPRHDVFISVISGASAGGVTGALAILSAAQGIEPVEEAAINAPRGLRGDAPPRKVRRVLGPLYDAWVRRPRLFGGRGGQAGTFLGISDMADRSSILVSALDSSPLEAIADETIAAIKPSGRAYPFLTDPLHLFLTLTNLDGVPYVIPFGTDRGKGHYMLSHADRVHFAVRGLGGRPFPEDECTWLKDWSDTGIEIRPSGLTGSEPENAEARRMFVDAVLATSAYPVGLKPRQIRARRDHYRNRAWPIEPEDKEKWGRPLEPVWPDEDAEDADLHFVAVDGGAIDNEPFDLARWTIRATGSRQNPRDARVADRAVIMIDPFPEPPAIDAAKLHQVRTKDLVLGFVLKALLPALSNQARFKLSDLLQANDDDTASRYMVAPQRTVGGVPARPELASALLEAFGGFLDERFREHDFELGRRNCQWFLKHHFVLHRDNPVFGPEMRGDDVDETWRIAEKPSDPNDPKHWRPIIPLMGSARQTCELPPWPKLPEGELDVFEKAFRRRLSRIVRRTIDANVRTALWNFAARFIWRYMKRDQVISQARLLVEGALYRNQQIAWQPRDEAAGRAPTTEREYRIIASLCDPRWQFRTIDGIIAELNQERHMQPHGREPVTARDVEAAFEKFGRRIVRGPRSRKRPDVYALRHRVPDYANPFVRVFKNNHSWTMEGRE